MKKNEALAPLSFLIGTWDVKMVHVQLPEPLTWQDSFDWLEDSFIIWHWQGKNEVPKAVFIIGRNEHKTGALYTMLYYDDRGVSRLIEMSLEKNIWQFRRESSDFFQRFEGTVNERGDRIDGHGEMSHDSGKTWNHDYDITYTKITE